MIWKIAYKEILKHSVLGSVFLKHLEAQILKNLLLYANHGGAFIGSKYVPVYPYITGLFSNICTSLPVHYWIIFQYMYQFTRTSLDYFPICLLSQFKDAVHMHTIYRSFLFGRLILLFLFFPSSVFL